MTRACRTPMAFKAHAEWVRELKEEYHSRQQAPPQRSTADSLVAQLAAGFDHNVNVEDAEGSSYFRTSSVADSDVDSFAAEAPTYRGCIGPADYFFESAADHEVGYDEPVFRGLGPTCEDSESAQDVGANDEQQDTDWLASMPPLIQRQNGRRA
ncbi:MAG: hypothetical protein SGPRY_006043 [Prymnesium sp.]